MKSRATLLCCVLGLAGCYQGVQWDASAPDRTEAGDTDETAADDGSAEPDGGSTGGDSAPDPQPEPEPETTGDDSSDEDPPEAETGGEVALSFSADIWPWLEVRCSCHGHVAGGLLMVTGSVYGKLVDVASQDTALDLVEPGRPEDSYLFRKLVGDHLEIGGVGTVMPPSGSGLSEDEIAMIEDWIIQGAHE